MCWWLLTLLNRAAALSLIFCFLSFISSRCWVVTLYKRGMLGFPLFSVQGSKLPLSILFREGLRI